MLNTIILAFVRERTVGDMRQLEIQAKCLRTGTSIRHLKKRGTAIGFDPGSSRVLALRHASALRRVLEG